MKTTVVAAALLLFALPSFAADDLVCKTDWGYEESNGPDRWGQIAPAYVDCDSGIHQSPVPLGNTGTAPNPLTAQYGSSSITIQRTAHGMNVYTLGMLNNLRYGTVNARLQKFHLHAPAEHPSGAAVAELHLVHVDANTDRGYVIAVLIDSDGAPNSAIQALIDSAPEKACTSAKLETFPLAALLPSTTNFTTYTGSLTTPPCSPNITFFVLKTHLKISSGQFTALTSLFEGARPPQPVNSRPFLVR
jgi:carbonic anhydrase